jgi:hypothetical protein
MTSSDLESRSRSTILYKLDPYLWVRHLYAKAEVSNLIIAGDIIKKPKVGLWPLVVLKVGQRQTYSIVAEIW